MSEKWNLSKDKGDSVGALLIDLSKAFGCLSHVFVYGKILALDRFTPYITVSKRRFFMNAFFRSQFSYCPLVWMCHSRTLNNKINRFQKRYLRIAYNDKLSSFQNLLDQDKSVSLHTRRNVQTLAIKMYKVSKGIAPNIFADIFSCNSRANYDLS